MILVTGATGTTGSVVLRDLLERGQAVRALTHSSEKVDELRALGADVAVGDLNDPATLAGAMRGIERVYLVQTPNADQVGQEINAISVAEQSGVYHLVKLGSIAQDVQSPCRFLRVHAEVTDALQQTSLRWTVLQPGGFMQNYLGQADAVKQGRLVSARPDAKVAFVDARDVGAVAAKALAEEGHENCTYVLTGPDAISDTDIASTLGVELVAVGDEDVRGALRGAGYPEWLADGLVELDGVYRDGVASTATADIEAVLGRKPRSFADFAADHSTVFSA